MQTFRAWEYDCVADAFGWVEYTRDSLIDLCVHRAFEKRYGGLLRAGAKVGDFYGGPPGAMVPKYRSMPVMMANVLRGVTKTVLSTAEYAAIVAEWNEFWRGRKVDGWKPSHECGRA